MTANALSTPKLNIAMLQSLSQVRFAPSAINMTFQALLAPLDLNLQKLALRSSCVRIGYEHLLRRRTLGKPSQIRYVSSEAHSISKTPLYDAHISGDGKMVKFANFSMPVQYGDLSVSQSHQWTREKASLFDVGHMVQHRLSGPDATKLLSKITPTSLGSLEPYHSTLSCFLMPITGGIIDDTVITRLEANSYYLVTNAACRDKDIDFITTSIKENDLRAIEWERLDGWGLIALQGPLSSRILDNVLAQPKPFDLQTLYFGQCVQASIDLGDGRKSEPLLISRAGYTGEDGFEISIPPNQTLEVTKRFFSTAGSDQLRWAGLAARDSLRLEAGMCLYGHDLDESTTPVEAGLSWIIGKDRREKGDFNGAKVIVPQLTSTKSGGTGLTRRRVGLVVEGAPAREGAVLVGTDEENIGKITSGSPSPSLGQNIAMGYIKQGWHKIGTEVGVMVRGKRRKGIITKMPFVPSRYWKRANKDATSRKESL